ncbi:CDP-diacylglycerol--glycerol-3-phosphate 3-phosphatidyltransferase [Zavarzinia sp. CC-PAN008]|uniref:CDP-diacylglycerol--glycerol-3-phosphate 3-phosphatidyltransferase n=1 Tax=Zavarzinia sp. CC-PAN008 TaxID=3243332 RepID=UPI003F746ACC
MLFSLPNLLTMSRIAAIPAVVATFFFDDPVSHWLAVVLFVAAGITDWADGYWARRLNQQSPFGRFLDPIADKLLVAAVVLMLVASSVIVHVHVLAALVILCREILVSGLREFLAEVKVGLPVTRLAKWKTAAQMMALTSLLVADSLPGDEVVLWIGLLFLWLAAALTLVTGFDYLRVGLRHMMGPQAQPLGEPIAGKQGRAAP